MTCGDARKVIHAFTCIEFDQAGDDAIAHLLIRGPIQDVEERRRAGSDGRIIVRRWCPTAEALVDRSLPSASAIPAAAAWFRGGHRFAMDTLSSIAAMPDEHMEYISDGWSCRIHINAPVMRLT